MATNRAGFSESISITIKIDKTPPALLLVRRTPPPNAAGWNNTDVRVEFTATDALSGLEGAAFVDVFVSAEGAGQAVTYLFMDRAGNTVEAVIRDINLDKTPPTITATQHPPPNAAGWNNTDVTGAFACRDDLSGMAGCTDPITLGTEGVNQSVTGTAVDRADNRVTASVQVSIDKTPPEAVNQFDPVTLDVVLFGQDALSGLPPGPVAPQSIVPIRWGDEDSENATEHGNAELRTYQVQDRAGNTLHVVEIVKQAGHEIKARILSLQTNTGPVLILPRNKKAFEWALTKEGILKELEQKLTVGQGPSKQEVEAKFEVKKNQTTIKVEHPKPENKSVKPGLVLLRLVTINGRLLIEF